MASVDKVKIGDSTYDVSPSASGTLIGYTSSDSSSTSSWTTVDPITAAETNSSIFSKLTKMVKNIRFLYSKLGTTDFSAVGNNVSDALTNLNNNKAASTHSHTTANLPVSSSQTNSTSYIPTSSLIYSMNTKFNTLNTTITGHETRIAKLEQSGGSWSLMGNNYKFYGWSGVLYLYLNNETGDLKIECNKLKSPKYGELYRGYQGYKVIESPEDYYAEKSIPVRFNSDCTILLTSTDVAITEGRSYEHYLDVYLAIIQKGSQTTIAAVSDSYDSSYSYIYFDDDYLSYSGTYYVYRSAGH